MLVNQTSAQQILAIVKQLKESQIYRDYEKAFGETMGLPLDLLAVGASVPAYQDSSYVNPFCALIGKARQSCSACLESQKKVEQAAHLKPTTLKCFAGLNETVVPVTVDGHLIAYLKTGQILPHKPTKKNFSTVTQKLLKWGSDVDLKPLEEAYDQTRVLGKVQYEAVLQLLSIFAQHLSRISAEMIVKQQDTEFPVVALVRAYIADHIGDEISLTEISKVVNMSAFYFCKMFKKSTGMTFTNYLARGRIENVKKLLLSPHNRINQAAYSSGFRSLSQFHRVFRKLVGESPTAYRNRVKA